MRARLRSLRVRSFRGVPTELEIDLGPRGSSLVVLGDNGTGKSTIADALEYYFTGRIDFLAREGRSIFHHIASSAEEMSVDLEFTEVTLNGVATQASQQLAARQIGDRESFILRGRTLAQFVESSKGEKFKALSSLLGLGPVEKLRQDLYNARNALDGEHTNAQARLAGAEASLGRVCPTLTEAGLLREIQETAAVVGISLPESLMAALDTNWMSSFQERDSQVKRVSTMQDLAAKLRDAPVVSLIALRAWNATASRMSEERPVLLMLRAGAQMMGAGQRLDVCPLCRRPIDHLELEHRIVTTLSDMEISARALERAERGLRQVIAEMRTAWNLNEQARESAVRLGLSVHELPSSPVPALEAAQNLGAVVNDGEVQGSLTALAEWRRQVSAAVIAATPVLGQGDQALGKLFSLVSQGRAWINCRKDASKAGVARSLAQMIYEGYTVLQGQHFQEVLGRISERLGAIYSALHPDEEFGNVGLQMQGEKGVELTLGFHGSQMCPPHAVVSESHLNSLGIALFLSMVEAFNERLGLVVLDDVVNSFDSNHRGALAEMLARDYDEWQLMILTHDQLFYNRLAKLRQSWKKVEFTSWSYEEGPRLNFFQTGLLLEKAQVALEHGDRVGAAAKGRRYVEEMFQEACEGVGGPLPFRRGFRNDRREIGEVVKGLRRGLKDLRALPIALSDQIGLVEADVQNVFNVEAHASQVTASVSEIRQALARVATLDAQWTCVDCGTRVWSKGDISGMTCDCRRRSMPDRAPENDQASAHT